jgi:hypothetical protein
MTTSEQSFGKVATETSPAMPEPDSMIQQQQKSWESFLNRFWKSEEYKDLWVFLKRTLVQLRLYGIRSEIDVILETDKITRGKIEDGEKIVNPAGWFRVTAFNVIRNFAHEETRQRKIIKKLENKGDSAYYPEDCGYEDFSEEQFETLGKNFNRLSELERTILILREVKNLPWEEVGKHLVSKNLETDNSGLMARLRKKRSRILKKCAIFIVNNHRKISQNQKENNNAGDNQDE